MKAIYESPEVEHALNCHSVDCTLSDKDRKRHFKVYCFQTADKEFIAKSIDKAARLWIDDGAKELIQISTVG